MPPAPTPPVIAQLYLFLVDNFEIVRAPNVFLFDG